MTLPAYAVLARAAITSAAVASAIVTCVLAAETGAAPTMEAMAPAGTPSCPRTLAMSAATCEAMACVECRPVMVRVTARGREEVREVEFECALTMRGIACCLVPW